MQTRTFNKQGQRRALVTSNALGNKNELAGTKCLTADSGSASITKFNNSIWLRLRPASISPHALTAVLQEIADYRPERVMISYLDQAWRHEIYRSWQAGLQRTLGLVDGVQAAASRMFLKSDRPRESLIKGSPLNCLLEEWERMAGNLDIRSLSNLLEDRLGGRYLAVVQNKQSGELVVRSVGSGFPYCNDIWREQMPGLRLQDQPDYSYGKWIADIYRQVLEGRQPVVHDVDAIVRVPRVGDQRYCYRRLILPVQYPDGSKGLLGASVLDKSVDLRSYSSIPLPIKFAKSTRRIVDKTQPRTLGILHQHPRGEIFDR